MSSYLGLYEDGYDELLVMGLLTAIITGAPFGKVLTMGLTPFNFPAQCPAEVIEGSFLRSPISGARLHVWS